MMEDIGDIDVVEEETLKKHLGNELTVKLTDIVKQVDISIIWNTNHQLVPIKNYEWLKSFSLWG